ncbi:MAG: 16S rRNA (adenine(1518)-N(6)/adenine(1519)-N(6))-dimethyltransferase RsmA [Gemmataceae bacterium]
MSSASRQTVSYLRGLFQQHAIHPKNKLGQNFLIDLNLLEMVVKSADLQPGDVILEVGSGTGSLTVQLIQKARAVVAVELDPNFAGLTAQAVQTHLKTSEGNKSERSGGSIDILNEDILDGKNKLNEAVLERLRGLLQEHAGSPLKLVANLPYAVAVPVLSNLLLTDLPLSSMVIMIQWEIAERLMASPGTKAYGSLAVLVQNLARVELVRKIPPSAFWPKPLVDSAIVRVIPDASLRARIPDLTRFRHFLRDLYSHRRKNLRGALAAIPGNNRNKKEIDALLEQLGISGADRAESLGLDEHRKLCESFT